MLDHSGKDNLQQRISEFGERFGRLLATGRFRIRENTLLNRTYISEHLIALSTGLMKEERSVGRTGVRFTFRIELLNTTDQGKVRRMFGETIEWINAKQISAATGISRSTASRRCKRAAALLIADRDTMRIIHGEATYEKTGLINVSDAELRPHLEEYFTAAQSGTAIKTYFYELK